MRNSEGGMRNAEAAMRNCSAQCVNAIFKDFSFNAMRFALCAMLLARGESA
jgi:hypothetical protein